MKTHVKVQITTLVTAAGLLLGCNPSVETASQKFNELPPAVQKTIRAQAPQAEIVNVSKTSANGMDAFEVQLRDQGRTPKIVVAANGTLLTSELGRPPGAVERMLTPTGSVGTPFSALPVVVQKTIQAQVPNGQIAGISRHEANGRTIYEVEFKDQGKNPTIQVAEDGTLVQTLQQK